MRGRGNDANQPTPRVLFNDGPRGGSEGAGRLEEQVKKATTTTETTTRRPGAQALFPCPAPSHDANVPSRTLRAWGGISPRPHAPTSPKARGNGRNSSQQVYYVETFKKLHGKKELINLHAWSWNLEARFRWPEKDLDIVLHCCGRTCGPRSRRYTRTYSIVQ